MVGRVWKSHHKRPLALAIGSVRRAQLSAALVVSTTPTLRPRACLPPAEQPMAPPRDTAGSAGTPQQPQQADAPGRYNQKSTFRNGTTEEGWFYPTPAALKAAADVRGARAAR